MGASLTGFKFDLVDGVKGNEMSDKAIPKVPLFFTSLNSHADLIPGLVERLGSSYTWLLARPFECRTKVRTLSAASL